MRSDKYTRRYFLPPEPCLEWSYKEYIDQAPVWCSVDLRDGNQSLIEPMSLDEKLAYFRLLTGIGFKEIEVGFPAFSENEFYFVRALIDQKLIPEDVRIQVLVPPTEHMIRKTFEAVKGASNAIIKLVSNTGDAFRRQVLNHSLNEIRHTALTGASLIRQYAEATQGSFVFEYCPESFTDTEVDFSLELINNILDIWRPDQGRQVIITLSSSMALSLPHVFASQVEYIHKHVKYRDQIILGIHPHNDRGTGVADAELGLLAGSQRVEGSLFGNGERTGNADLIVLALNLLTHGVDPGLDFSDMQGIREKYERLTSMHVHPRTPYSGELVFSAFADYYQDSVMRGLDYRRNHEDEAWMVPYLVMDPQDLGKAYNSDLIRINSQSGKSGVAYVLKQEHGLSLPDAMKEEVGRLIQDISDHEHKELSPGFIYQVFEDKYINRDDIFSISNPQFRQLEDGVLVDLKICQGEEERAVTANGNGRLSAVSNAIKQYFDISFELTVYEEHALSRGSSSKAATYVGISKDGAKYWGVGIHEDIIVASIQALSSAVNQVEELSQMSTSKDQRLLEILNYIQMNYLTVTLEELSEKFFLSKPYLSKYIKEKSGSTFGETLKRVRMKKARMLLKNRNMTVESIAESVGYQNVEHFNRLFKKAYGMTPIQFRNQKSELNNR